MKTTLSNTNKNAGKIVIVESTPMNTPFAITTPISNPKVSCIVHSAKNPAMVVNELPAIETSVSPIASVIASLFVFTFSFACSYL